VMYIREENIPHIHTKPKVIGQFI